MSVISLRNTILRVAAVTTLFAGSVAQAESLSDAMIAAYQTSNLLDQQRALLRAADEDVVQTAAALKPVIDFTGSTAFRMPRPATATSNWSASLSLSASLTLYDNGQTRFAKDAAKETVLGLRGALLQVEQQVLLSTVQAYMEMIRSAQAVSLSTSNVRLITQELRAARDRFQVGEVTRTDVAIAEARLASSRGNLAAAQGDLEIARETYKAVVGRYPGHLRWPTNPPVRVKTEHDAKAFAVRNHPSIEEAQRNVNAAELGILRARAALGVSVAASAETVMDQDFDTTFTTGLSATVPIYRGGTLRSVIRQAIASRDASRAQLLQVVIDVKRDVGIAWANLAVASARTEASRREVRAAQVAFNGVREEARFGARTTLDVLNAEQDLLDARTNLITAEVQQYISLYSLFSAMGLLTSENLQLGIPTYDPVEYYRYATTRGPMEALSRRGGALDRVLKTLKP
ncbi:MAG: TolC family outer membrane protein [Pseudomonadota bacterium]